MKSLETESLHEPICDTCLTRLDDSPFRKLVLKEKNGVPLIICIHYFAPCWDQDLINEKYSNYEIVFAGFSLDSKSLPNPKAIRNLQNNLDLW